jgi:hypothetical protein
MTAAASSDTSGCISAEGNLTVCPSVAPLGDAPHKLEKLRSPNDRVWDRRGFDQILLRDLRAEVTTGEQAVVPKTDSAT